ncbi:MAG: FAD:protein FMN transferase [Oscillospiraceae bacterium]|nr:FAD:protein FMN transferase [Oscillospiraceae bacterium]
MKRILCALLCAAMLLSGCTAPAQRQTRYNATFLTLFDTVTTIVGFAKSEEEFHAVAQSIHDELLTYHQLFDIYNSYDGINNLKTINDNAGIAPVAVERVIIDLLLDCKEYYAITNGMVNAAMGSVLHLWHEARNDGIDDPLNAYLPDDKALEDAAAHISMDSVVIDEGASTVFITDSRTRLDVGAIAKGWATERAAQNAPEGLLISVGGNVRATGNKDENGSPWVVGIQNPDDAEQYLHSIYVYADKGSVVTSGDYQRTYAVDGKLYHHIIDPATRYPATRWNSVTIVCADSGAADALSTALFLMDYEAGLALLAQFDAEAMWVAPDGSMLYSPGFAKLIRT